MGTRFTTTQQPHNNHASSYLLRQQNLQQSFFLVPLSRRTSTAPELCLCSLHTDAYFFVVLHVQVVLVSVLVAAGQRDDGDGVDGLHQRSLCQSLGHHLAAKVRHCVPDGRQKQETGGNESQPAAGCSTAIHNQLTQLNESANCPNNNMESIEKSHRRVKPAVPAQFSRTLSHLALQ